MSIFSSLLSSIFSYFSSVFSSIFTSFSSIFSTSFSGYSILEYLFFYYSYSTSPIFDSNTHFLHSRKSLSIAPAWVKFLITSKQLMHVIKKGYIYSFSYFAHRKQHFSPFNNSKSSLASKMLPHRRQHCSMNFSYLYLSISWPQGRIFFLFSCRDSFIFRVR